jgi:hypothetical protein
MDKLVNIHQSKVERVFGQGTWKPIACALLYQSYSLGQYLRLRVGGESQPERLAALEQGRVRTNVVSICTLLAGFGNYKVAAWTCLTGLGFGALEDWEAEHGRGAGWIAWAARWGTLGCIFSNLVIMGLMFWGLESNI